ncbi:Cysteine desulfurase [Roseomonas gilardii subsp. rosea]|nr:Cysteine desulfurase [Roseomonas gilardii subsp. rosea]
MTPPALYLDANATEPLRPEARFAALEAMDLTGNPSSVHAEGRAARRLLEKARAQVAVRFGARARDVVFTSGGTEADTLAIRGLGRGRRILAGATEHPAVLAAAPEAERLPVDGDGVLDLAALERALSSGAPALVCLMLANNETGVIHPVAEALALCRRHDALLHVDAVQAAGRMPVSLEELGADSLALSGHKLGGPKGAGALLLRPGLDLPAHLPGEGRSVAAGAAPNRCQPSPAWVRPRRPPIRTRRSACFPSAAPSRRAAAPASPGPGRRACPTRRACCCPACRRRPRSSRWTWPESGSRRARPVPPARWRAAMCWRRWGWARRRAAPSASRSPGTRRRMRRSVFSPPMLPCGIASRSARRSAPSSGA